MRGIRLLGKEQLGIDDLAEPVPTDSEALIMVDYCALCRTDAKMWQSGHRDLVYPRVPGHEISGRDAATGERYVVWPGEACGACTYCRTGRDNLCPKLSIIGFNKDGGLAEKVAVARASLIPMPAEVDERSASLAEPLACAIHALDSVNLQAGDSVVIYGAGPVGLLVALAAIDRGARVFVKEPNERKLSKSTEFRLSVGIDSGDGTTLPEHDVAINATGDRAAFVQAVRSVNPGGRFCFFSGLSGDDSLDPKAVNEIHYRELIAVGAYGCGRQDMESALIILTGHEDDVVSLIEQEIGLDDVAHVLPAIAAGEMLKVVVRIS